jgi:hypothetical protein
MLLMYTLQKVVCLFWTRGLLSKVQLGVPHAAGPLACGLSPVQAGLPVTRMAIAGQNIRACMRAGLTGGSHDSYVKHAVLACRRRGLRAVVFNSRGTSDGPVSSPQFYSASYTGDMRCAATATHAMLSSRSPAPRSVQAQTLWGEWLLCRLVVKEVAALFPDSVLLAAGWSLGGVPALSLKLSFSNKHSMLCSLCACSTYSQVRH